MFAILTAPGKEGRWNASEFFESGRAEIAGSLSLLHDRFGLAPLPHSALDFGCGVGRLTQALAERFERVQGVDISDVMIEEARKLNRHGDRVTYHVNASDRLSMIPDRSVNFLYSRITLQHIPRAAVRRYLSDFPRVLASGGIAMFQILTRARSRSVRVRHFVRDLFPDAYRRIRDGFSRRARWEMNVFPESEVREIMRAAGAAGTEVFDDASDHGPFDSRWFVVTMP